MLCMSHFAVRHSIVLKSTKYDEKKYIKELVLKKHTELQLSLPIVNNGFALMTSYDLFRLYADEGYWILYPSIESFFENALNGEIDITQREDINFGTYRIKVLKRKRDLIEKCKDKGINCLIPKHLKQIKKNTYKLNNENIDLDELGTVIYIMNTNKYFVFSNKRDSELIFTKVLSKG